MRFTCHSEYLRLEKVIIKPAKNAFVSDDLLEEQWKPLHFLSKPVFDVSINEYADFEDKIKKEGIEILYLPKDDRVTIDSIYCRMLRLLQIMG